MGIATLNQFDSAPSLTVFTAGQTSSSELLIVEVLVAAVMLF